MDTPSTVHELNCGVSLFLRSNSAPDPAQWLDGAFVRARHGWVVPTTAITRSTCGNLHPPYLIHCPPCVAASCIADHICTFGTASHISTRVMHSLYLLYMCIYVQYCRQHKTAASRSPPTCVSRRPIRTGIGPHLQRTCAHETAVNNPGPAPPWVPLLLWTIYAECGRYLWNVCICISILSIYLL